MSYSDGGGSGSGVDLYLVRHAESCSNIVRSKSAQHSTYRRTHRDTLHEPVLSINGYIQSFQLRYHLHGPGDYDYDDMTVICSPLVRTVVTAMIALSTFDDQVNHHVIHIVPYVKVHDKKLSMVNSVAELKEKIHNFTTWFRKRGIHMYQLFREIHPVAPKRITAIHFPRLDYAALEEYERRFRENERIDVMEEFQKYIVRSMSRSMSRSFLVFTHKRFIMKMTRCSKVPANTSITKVTMNDTGPEPGRNDGRGDIMSSSKVIYRPRLLNPTRKIQHKPELEMCRNTFLSTAHKRFVTRRRHRHRHRQSNTYKEP
jgi:phosphohistidine phosphatase SixA